MSWLEQLATTYDNCRQSIGYGDEADQRPLLPICHSTTQAHIEIEIDIEGSFRFARVIFDKAEMTTIHPSTESSASRAGSQPVNHPFCDKLQYVAGDFVAHGGKVTSGFAAAPNKPFNDYVAALSKWCNSEFGHPKARAVLAYVKKRSVVRDLADYQVLLVGENGKLLTKAEAPRGRDARDIFSVVDPQDVAFVRWVVTGGDGEPRTWRDRSLWESWIAFYLAEESERSTCYVTGETVRMATNHPRSIRREGDGAKLISANDTSGFTFRGRFVEGNEVCGVGLDVSQKAHGALAWLIDRQGYRKGDLAIVAWAVSGAPVIQPTNDMPFELFGMAAVEEEAQTHTADALGRRFKQRIAGYGKALGNTDHVLVAALDSATPGRLALVYFRQLTASAYLERVEHWHASCQWLHRYRFVDVKDPQSGKLTRAPLPFVGAPAPSDIAEAAYGSRLDDKLRAATIQRLLPCIVDGLPLPRDLVESVVRRAANRGGLGEYEWEKALSIACALYRKANENKESYDMPLDPERRSRDYLYGRALALADSLEQWALNEADEKRETNAARLMQRFAQHPYSTWYSIELALAPYKARLGLKSAKRQQMIDEVIAAFAPDDFINDKPLSGEFLLGYHSQREHLRSLRGQTEVATADATESISEEK